MLPSSRSYWSTPHVQKLNIKRLSCVNKWMDRQFMLFQTLGSLCINKRGQSQNKSLSSLCNNKLIFTYTVKKLQILMTPKHMLYFFLPKNKIMNFLMTLFSMAYIFFK